MNPIPMLVINIPSSTPVEVTTMNSKLFEAVTSGKKASLQGLVISSNSGILQQVTPAKDTCLHIAAGRGHYGIVEMILGLNPQLLTQVNSMGETALHRATRAGHYTTAKLLIDTAKSMITIGSGRVEEMFAFIRAKNKQMETAMHIAVRYSHSGKSSSPHFKIASLLIQEDPELLCEVNHVGESPLHIAAEQGSFNIVSKMLESNRLSYAGPKDRTALHTAVIHERADITRLLLKQELVRKGDVNGRTPLHFASALGFCEIVEILLRYDLSTTCYFDTDGFAAIHLAATFGHLKIIKQFLQFQPDLKDLSDRRGQNLLQIAISSEQFNVVKYILSEKRFEEILYWRDEESNTHLHHAVVVGNPNIVRILVRDKRMYAMAMDLNKDGCSALSIARSKCEQTNELRQVLVLETLVYALPGKQSIYNYIRRHEEGNIEAMRNLAEESKTLMVVSALIVSVTFTAGLTISGGETVTPAKAEQFDRFIRYDCKSLYLALVTVIMLVPTYILQHPHQAMMYKSLRSAQTTTMLSLAYMALAFSSGLDMIRPQSKHVRWFFLDHSSLLVYLAVLLQIGIVGKAMLRAYNMINNGYESWKDHHDQDKDTTLTVGEIIEWMNRKHVHNSQAP